MNNISDTIVRRLNEFETERDLARYLVEDGNHAAAAECFNSARMLMYEIEALFSRVSRARASPTPA